MAISITTSAAEYTDVHQIKTIEWDGSTNKMYFTNITNGGWGAPGCPDAVYILIDPSLTQQETFRSLGIAAHATKANVKFYGSCDQTSQFNFIASYMTLF